MMTKTELDKNLNRLTTYFNDVQSKTTAFLEAHRTRIGTYRAGLTGVDLLTVAKAYGATPETLHTLNLRKTTPASKFNYELLCYDMKVFNSGEAGNSVIVADIIQLTDQLNEQIRDSVQWMFERLNDEILGDERFHKAICLKRDIARLAWAVKCDNSVDLDTLTFEDLKSDYDYVSIEPNLEFLNESFLSDRNQTESWLVNVGSYVKYGMKDVKLRMLFLERLQVFGIE